MWHRVFALVTKELLAVFKDVKSRIVLIVPPLLQLVVFGYAATYDLNHVPFAVYNEDPSQPSRELVARFEGAPAFQEIARIHNNAEIAPLINERKALMVLHIDRRFSRDLLRGIPGPIEIILDGRNSNTALLAAGYANTILSDFNSWWAARHGGVEPPARLDIRARFNENLESRWFIVPAIVALLTQVVALLVTALSVAREREAGTFDQLLVTPMRPIDILIGKSIPGLLIGVVEATFIITVGVLWFEVPLRGGFVALYLGLFLFLLSVIGVGLMVSSLSVTQQQALLGTFLFMVPSVILSGFATPIANMPLLVQYLTYLNPMRYFLIVVRGVFLEGSSSYSLTPQYWPMLLIGVATLAMAGWLFRRRLY
ncbi:MAG TPA: ABC transporter permease [Candidatus Binataceae bacterium]|nr:ABC transporter permease [Candidatus Binataceae bacterium]